MSDATAKQRAVWSQHLHRMRGPGSRRKQRGKPSTSLAPLLNRLPKGSTLVDVGCGESGDRHIANKAGFVSYGVDVFRPSCARNFIQADALALPFPNSSIDGIVNHAMIALVAPNDRWRFYDEAVRVLRPKGLFSITPLADGFEVRAVVEDDKIYFAGLHKLRAGLYTKCGTLNCAEHPDPNSFAAIQLAVDRTDTDEQFRKIAPLLIAWIAKGGSFKKTVEFTGCNPDYLHFILRRMVDCKLFDAKTGTATLSWLTYHLDATKSVRGISR